MAERVSERVVEEAPLVDAADHRRVEMACEARSARVDGDESERRERLALPLDGERLEGLHGDRVADQAVGRGAEQHLAEPRRLLEPRGDVDRRLR